MLKIFKTLYFFTSFIFLLNNYELSASSKTENNFRAVKEYLNNLNTLEASFIQISSDGNVKRGKIFLNLPGKLRIDYIQTQEIDQVVLISLTINMIEQNLGQNYDQVWRPL
mgnify:CR=1 FL=1